FTQRPVSDIDNETALFGKRNELRRGNQTTLRVKPAHQSFEAENPATLQHDFRLVVQAQLAAGYNVTKIGFQVGSLAGMIAHVRIKDHKSSATFIASFMHGDI